MLLQCSAQLLKRRGPMATKNGGHVEYMWAIKKSKQKLYL